LDKAALPCQRGTYSTYNIKYNNMQTFIGIQNELNMKEQNYCPKDAGTFAF